MPFTIILTECREHEDSISGFLSPACDNQANIAGMLLTTNAGVVRFLSSPSVEACLCGRWYRSIFCLQSEIKHFGALVNYTKHMQKSLASHKAKYARFILIWLGTVFLLLAIH